MSELILLTVFSVLAYYLGENVFYVMFVAGAIGAHVVRRSTEKSNIPTLIAMIEGGEL